MSVAGRGVRVGTGVARLVGDGLGLGEAESVGLGVTLTDGVGDGEGVGFGSDGALTCPSLATA